MIPQDGPMLPQTTLPPIAPVSGANIPLPPSDSSINLPALPRPSGFLAPASAPPALNDMPGPMALLRALEKNWVLASTTAVLGAAAVAFVTWFYLVPSRYTARALLYVHSQTPRVLFETAEAKHNFGSYQRTQVALIKSGFVLNAALRQPKVANLPLFKNEPDLVEWLTKHLEVDYKASPEVLTIALKGENPEELVTLVNAVTTAYLQEIVNKEQVEQQGRGDRLKQIYTQYEDNLRSRRKTLRELAESAGSGDVKTLTVKQQFAMEKLAMAQKELMVLQSEFRKVQAEMKTAEKRDRRLEKVTVPDSVAEEYLKTDPVSQKLLARETALEKRIEETRRVAAAGRAVSLISRSQTELEGIRQSLAARRKELGPKIQKMHREHLRQQTDTSQASLADRLETMKEVEKQLTADVNRLADETRFINKSTLDLQSLREEIAQAENVAKSVAAENERLKVEALAPPRVRLLEAAELPRFRDNKKRITITAGAALAVLVLVPLGFAYREFRLRRVLHGDDLVHGLGMRLVGELPAPPVRLRRAAVTVLPTDEYYRNLLEESVDTMRTMLLHAAETQSLRVLMVTSAMPGEGKTTLAGHLARSLARVGHRVLLVDCDLRKPAVHRLFGLTRDVGLSEVLRGQAELDEAIQETGADGLHLLAAGQCCSTATKELARKRLGEIFQCLRGEYDFILVDTPPVLCVTDALLVSRFVDAALFATLRQVSTLPTLHAAYQRLAALNVPILGLVMNGVRCRRYDKRYRGYVGDVSEPETTLTGE